MARRITLLITFMLCIQHTHQKSKHGNAGNKKALELVEKKVLNFMGLTSKPQNISKHNITFPDHVWRLYKKWSHEGHEEPADVVRLLYHKGRY